MPVGERKDRLTNARPRSSILAMLEEKADGGRVAPSEMAAVRCVLESCAAKLDGAWARH